jgi:formylglycine-generating enzyme required for sulfatase activity
MIRVLAVMMTALLVCAALPADDGAEMALVPAGEFTIGGQGKAVDEDRAEAPAHKLALPAFLIDKLEVTTTLFCRFLNETGKTVDAQGGSYFGLPQYLPITQAGGQWQPVKGRESFPMTNVTWYGAMAYAKWAGKRLPTEAEFEKAARGTDGRKFVWGADFNTGLMRFGQENIGPVGGHPKGATVYGGLDMAGNVWEWTSSLFRPYPYVATDGREDAANTTERRVARGGSFTGEPYIATTTYRFRPYPEEAYHFLGFRCAKDAP